MLEPLIHAIINTKTDNKNDLMKLKRQFAREMKFDDIPSNIQLIATYNQMVKDSEIEPNEWAAKVLTKSPIRSQSGIVSVQVLTKPFWCPGKCIFCPNDFTMPKSYINTEPGAQRALLNNFDPVKQVYNRLLSLTMTWHKTDKVEMIVLWWTWDVYPEVYKEQFVKALYDACNTFPEFYKNVSLKEGEKKALSYTIDDYDIPYPETIEESQIINETWPSRIIWLTVETRPEYVTDENCRFWRKLGVTRLEIGIQSSDDAVLKANKRWHDHECSRQAIHKLRQYGFKMSIHIMPGLYTSSYKKDLKTFQDIYDDPSIKPDEIKFYPTSVIPNTELHDLYKAGEYKPLETETIKKIIKETFQNIIPPYTRIKRLIRDIPSTEIIAGSSITNLSQLTRQEIRDHIVGSSEAQALYAKLYQNSKLYATLDEYLTHQSHDLDERYKEIWDLRSSDIVTTIIGTQPNTTDYRNYVTLDTRSREIKHRAIRYKGMPEVVEQSETANLIIRQYTSSVWQEFFVSFEDALWYIYGFTRLLLPTEKQAIERESLATTTAVIRELHVYGKLAGLSPLDKTPLNGKKIQHTWLGTQLMQTAELIAQHYDYQKLTVISGIGVRGFYRKIGYELDGTYMSRKLTA